jgi:hypothetical protein
MKNYHYHTDTKFKIVLHQKHTFRFFFLLLTVKFLSFPVFSKHFAAFRTSNGGSTGFKT